MPVVTSYPGVYVEELPSSEKTVTGISTSTTAFVDFFARGPMSDERNAKAVQIFNYRDFQRTFGGLHGKSEASYAIMQYFQNGGQTAWVVRTDDGTGQAAARKVKVRIPFLEDFAKDAAEAAHQAARAAQRANNVVNAINSVNGALRHDEPKLQPGAAARAALKDLDKPDLESYDGLAVTYGYLRSALAAAETAFKAAGTDTDEAVVKEVAEARVHLGEVDTRKSTGDLRKTVETSLASAKALTEKAATAAEEKDTYDAETAAQLAKVNDGSAGAIESLRSIHYTTGFATQAASDHLPADPGLAEIDFALGAAEAVIDVADKVFDGEAPDTEVKEKIAGVRASMAAAEPNLAEIRTATVDALASAGTVMPEAVIKNAESTFKNLRKAAVALGEQIQKADAALKLAKSNAEGKDADGNEIGDPTTAPVISLAINAADEAIVQIEKAAKAAIKLVPKDPYVDTSDWPDLAIAVDFAARLTRDAANDTRNAADAAGASGKVLNQRILEFEAKHGAIAEQTVAAAEGAANAALGAKKAADNAADAAEDAAAAVVIKPDGKEAKEELKDPKSSAAAKEAMTKVAEAAEQAAEAANAASDRAMDAQVAAMAAGEAGAAPGLEIAAVSPGVWGNSLKAQVVSGTQYKFDVKVEEVAIRNGKATVIATELFQNLTLQDDEDANYALRVVNHQSNMIRLGYKGPAVKGACPVGDAATMPLERGRDGDIPREPKLIATMKYALENIAPSIFNILCLPITYKYPASEASMAINKAMQFCESKRAFMIVDIPENVRTVADMQKWSAKYGNAANYTGAVYYPRLVMPDPLQSYRPKNVGPSGTMAGVYARTDSRRGIWKAPAGSEAVLQGVQVASKMTDDQNGQLNPLGVNCLRSFPVYGNIAWGARTLAGADQLQSQWKYINVRRLVYYIEESLYQALKWAVFEGNDQNLWSQITQQVGSFLSGLFVDGAFAGGSPDKAYFVHCDATTTTAADVANGIVNIIVGIAPIKPAEFIILQIEQIAGQD